MVRSDGYELVPDNTVTPPPTYKLTTSDNPFHPVYEEQNWRRFDEDHGYNTDAYVDRLYSWDYDLTEFENQRLVNHAIDDACRLNITGVEGVNYVRVVV